MFIYLPRSTVLPANHNPLSVGWEVCIFGVICLQNIFFKTRYLTVLPSNLKMLGLNLDATKVTISVLLPCEKIAGSGEKNCFEFEDIHVLVHIAP
jgi:hypothetical protein